MSAAPEVFVAGLRGFPGVQGGIETHCQHLYPRLAKLGCRVTVFTRAPYVDASRVSYEGVRLVALDCPRHKHLETIVHTFKAVLAARRMGARLIHLHGIGPSVAAPLARLLGMRVVVTTQGQDYRRKKWNLFSRCFLRFCEAAGALACDRMIAVSEPIAEDLRRGLGKRASVIPNGVSAPQAETGSDTIVRYGLTPGKYVLAVGRLVPEKGFHDLIEAFRGSPAGWKLVIAGGSDHGDEYSRGIERSASGRADLVLTGALSGSPLRQLLRDAGLFVMPSYHEGLPLALLEAMGQGLSCIASDLPAHRVVELPEDRYFPAGDRVRLAEKLRRYIAEPFTDEQRRRQAERILREYDWDGIARRTLDVYRSIGGKVRP